MSHAGGDLTERFDAAQALGEREDFRFRAELFSRGSAAVDAEGDHPTAHRLPVLLDGNFALRVGGEAGIVHGENVRGRLQGERDGRGVFGGRFGSEMECLETSVGEPAVEGAWDRPDCVLEKGQTIVEL